MDTIFDRKTYTEIAGNIQVKARLEYDEDN